MKVGDLVKWSWHLGTDWATTHFMGVIIGSKLYKHAGYTEGFKCIGQERPKPPGPRRRSNLKVGQFALTFSLQLSY